MKRSIAVLTILWIAFLLPAYLSAKQTEAKMEFPFIGVTYEPIAEQTLSRPKVSRTIKKKIEEKLKKGQTGLYIVSVGRRTPAYKAGMRKGDILKQFNGQKIESHEDFIYWISQFKPGQEVTLTIERNGKLIDLPVTLAGKPVSPESTKRVKWIKLEKKLNPERKRMWVVIADKETFNFFSKPMKRYGISSIRGLGFYFIDLAQSYAQSSYPLITAFSPDQTVRKKPVSLEKIDPKYHYFFVIPINETKKILTEDKCVIVSRKIKTNAVTQILDEKGEWVIVSEIEGESYVTLVAAPNKRLLKKAITRFFTLTEIPLEPMIWKPK